MKILSNSLAIVCCAILMAAFIEVIRVDSTCAPIAISGIVVAGAAILFCIVDIVRNLK